MKRWIVVFLLCMIPFMASGGVVLSPSLEVPGTTVDTDCLQIPNTRSAIWYNSLNFKIMACSNQLPVDLSATTAPGTGITTLNGRSEVTQSFATGTSGTDVNIVSTSGLHTFNIPDASATNRGLVTSGAQSFGGAKTFVGGIIGALTGNSTGVTCTDCLSTTQIDATIATQAALTAHTTATTTVHGIPDTAFLVKKDGSVLQDKVVITDTDSTPVSNTQLQVKDSIVQSATTAGLEGRFISRDSIQTTDANSIGNDSVALGTKTTGNYVGQLTAGANITLTNCNPSEGPNCTISGTGTGGGTPGGVDTQVQFNDLSAFGGDAGLTYNKTTDVLTSVGGISTNFVGVNDTDATPVANLQFQNKDSIIQSATTGGVEGRFISRNSVQTTDASSIGNDSVALGTKTTGNYVGSLIAGTNITLTNCAAGEGPNCTIDAASASGAPVDATYLVSQSSVPLTNEVVLSTLGTGVLNVTTGTGAISSIPVDAANGIAALGPTGQLRPAELMAFKSHPLLAAPTTVNWSTGLGSFILVGGSGGAVTSTAATRIESGSKDGQFVWLCGNPAVGSFPWTLPHGGNVYLRAATGSIIFSKDTGCVPFVWIVDTWYEAVGMSLEDITRVGRKVTTANAKANAIEIGDGTTKTLIYSSGGKAIVECETAGVPCDNEWTVPVGKVGKFLSGADELVRITESTDTFQFLMGTLSLHDNVVFSLNAEQPNKTVIIPRPLWRPMAGCNNVTASAIWDLPTSGAASAACVTGANQTKAVLDFVDAATNSAQLTEALSSAWTGDIGVRIKWFSGTGSTNSVVFRIRAACVGDGEIDEQAWDSDVLTITDAGKGTANQTNDVAGVLLATSHLSTCAAGELLHIELARLGADAGDTHAATARVIGVEFLVREAW